MMRTTGCRATCSPPALVTGRGTANLRVAPSDAEYFDAAMRKPLLERIAAETEGRFYRAKDASELPDAIAYSG